MREIAVIRTPENVSFDHELAGLASRAAAWAFDLVVMVILIGAASQLLSALTPHLGGLAQALLFLVIFLVQWWYAALAEWLFSGRTLGKWVVGLRTIREDGLPIRFSQAVLRNLLRAVDLLPGLYLTGGISALLDPRGRRLGDLAAGTVVVRERRAPLPKELLPSRERHNLFTEDPTLSMAARRVSAAEREAMVGLGLRRDSLPLAVRRELFGRLAAHLQRRLGIHKPPTYSDEKLVLSLTAAVLSSGEKGKFMSKIQEK